MERFTESWETLSAGVVTSGVKSSGMKYKSYRLGYLLLITFNKKEQLLGRSREKDAGVQEDQQVTVTLQGSVVGEEGSWEGWTLAKQTER